MNALWVIPAFVAALTVSFLMSGMEAGVFALSRLRVRQQVRAGNPQAAVLLTYLENSERFLWTILVGNTTASLMVVGLAVWCLHRALWSYPVAFWLCLLVGVILFYALCDLLPKMLFRTYPNRLCLLLATPFRGLDFLLRPLVWLVEVGSNVLLRLTGGGRFTGHLFGNRDELRQLMQETPGSITNEERLMIHRVLDLQHRLAADIMTPLDKVCMVPSGIPVREVLDLRKERGFSRYLVFKTEAGRRRILGFVNVKQILYLEHLDLNKPVSDYLKPALYLEGSLRVDMVLKQMQRSGHRLAIVLGADRTEVGIVSLTDVLRAIFGEVRL